MASTAAQASRLSRAFDGALIALGAVVAAAAALGVLLGDPGTLGSGWVLLTIPVAVLMSRFPLVLTRRTSGIEVGFDSAVLVYLAVTEPAAVALLLWSLAVVGSQLVAQKRPAIARFNTGLGIVAGALALAVMDWVSDLDRPSLGQLGAVALGCAVYFVADYVLSGVSFALEERTSIAEVIVQRSAPVALTVFVAIDSLGYLAAYVLDLAEANWPGALLAVPLATILVATRTMARGNEHQRRLAALFDAAVALQSVRQHEDLVETLGAYAKRVVGSGESGVRHESPGPAMIGVVVRAGHEAFWLVAPARDRARATVDADRKALEALAAVGEEASARIGLVEEMSRRARHDALTGLANRTLFLDRVEHAVALNRRGGDGLAVLYVDLDGFKSVNDRFGHEAGDDLLRIVGGRLSGCLRDGDSVARLGGDEFAILLHQVTSTPQVELVCDRLMSALRPPVMVNGHEVVVEASIGVAVADPDDTAEDLLRNADMAMYRAKTLGKRRYAVYLPELREENIRRLELIERLRHGMASEFVVHYQPIIDLDSGQVSGLEALIRWERDGELVPPDAFIPVAEESGLVIGLGDVVLAQVLQDAPLLSAAAGRPLHLGVNVSAHQLREPGFLDGIRRAVTALGANTLVLEMTETVLIGDDEETVGMLGELASAGAKLAIDDFGVGFSSVGYLQHLPVDILKIDRSFATAVDCDERAESLVRAMVLMGSALGLRIVVEGLERPAQLERVRDIGAASAQGFLFSRPKPLGDVLALLGSEAAGGHRWPYQRARDGLPVG